jgi:hypothetical protein
MIVPIGHLAAVTRQARSRLNQAKKFGSIAFVVAAA